MSGPVTFYRLDFEEIGKSMRTPFAAIPRLLEAAKRNIVST